MTPTGLNQWLLAVIASLCLNAGIINLGYFISLGNTLPIQIILGLVSLAILFRLKVTSIKVFAVSAIAFFLIAIFNVSNPTSLITNPIIPLLGLMTLLAGTQLRVRNPKTLARAAMIFCAFQLVFQLYFNLSFSSTDALTERSKGYGSGTTYALMAATLLIYLTFMLSQLRLRTLAFCALAAVPLWTIFLTQSRGVFLSLVIILVVKNLFRMQSLFKLLALAAAVAFLFAMNPHFLNSIPLFERLKIGESFNIQAYSSGRIAAQIVILDWFASEHSIFSLLLGAEGLNGIKMLASRGFEFPHFDLLYLLYDTGLVGAALYLFLVAYILARTRFDSAVLLFFLSSLHTNMVLSPVFLLLALILHHTNRKERKNTGNF